MNMPYGTFNAGMHVPDHGIFTRFLSKVGVSLPGFGFTLRIRLLGFK